MKIVKIHGGLANQMFQYCFYLNLKESFHEVYLDTDTFDASWGFDDIKLIDVFKNVNYDSKKVSRFYTETNRYLDKLGLSLAGYIKEKSMKFSTQYSRNKNYIYFDGYWQSELYFENLTDRVRHCFEFNQDYDLSFEKILGEVKQSNSIALHVRKGKDYLQNPLLKGTCEIEYFKQAIEYINSRVHNPVYYIFSDNFNWVDDNLSFMKYEKVDHNLNVQNNYRDMQLMSNCKHNIISNSSFSWWSAWLNSNEQKIVVGPKLWFNSKLDRYDSSTIMPSNWIKL